MTQSELCALIRDCLLLWDIGGTVSPSDASGAVIDAASGLYSIEPAAPDDRPVRWYWQSPERTAAHRPPRAAPSVVSALSGLRNALGAEGGPLARVSA